MKKKIGLMVLMVGAAMAPAGLARARSNSYPAPVQNARMNYQSQYDGRGSYQREDQRSYQRDDEWRDQRGDRREYQREDQARDHRRYGDRDDDWGSRYQTEHGGWR